MKLKSLTINGFKSFAEKTTIEFNNGVTGIVGPNGSGKSNIIEAIRWVLGETSAKSLRGSKMPDVIFSGSDSRGPSNRAEVTLVFDNSDHQVKQQADEIIIKRKIYRDGESKYEINDKDVRLRDINDLLLDTGLGKESFSIISQGKVEEIFNSKPEDRRYLIEQAAGILKYKKEKQNAQDQLVQTDDHLNRVTDIISELETSLDPLSKQASIARDYKRQKEEYDKYRINELVLLIQNLQTKNQTNDVVLDKTGKLLRQYDLEVSQQEQYTNKLHDSQKILTEQLDKVQSEYVELSAERERLIGLENVFSQKSQFKHSQQKEWESQKLLQEQTKKQLQDKLNVLENQLSTNKQQLTKLSSDIQQLDKINNLKPDDLKKDIEHIRQQIITFLKEQTSVQNELTYLKKDKLKQDAQSKAKQELMNNLHRNLDDITEDINTLKNRINPLKSDLDRDKKSSTSLAKDIKEYDKKQKKLREQWFKASQILQKATTRKETLEQLENNFSNYFQGVKAILDAKNEIDGIVGSVAQNINVESKYALAIETVLGNRLQNVVVKNDDVAKKAIVYLNKKSLGKATFLPLNIIEAKPHPSIKNMGKNSGIIGWADELVHSNIDIRPIISNLLANTLVVDNLEHANQIALDNNHKFKLVTLQGSTIGVGGSMTGGKNRQHHGGILAQRSEIAKLSSDCSLMKKQLDELDSKSVSLDKQINQLIEQKDKLDSKIAENSSIYQNLSNQLSEYNIKQQNISNQLHNMGADEDKIKEFTNNTAQLTSKKQQIDIKITELQQELASKSEQLDNLEQQNDKTSQQKYILQSKLTLINERLDTLNQQYNDVTVQLSDVEEKINDYKTRLSSLDKELNDEASQAEIKKQRMSVEDSYSQKKQDITKLQVQRDNLHNQVVDAENKLNRLTSLQKVTYNQQKEYSYLQGQYKMQLQQELDSLANEFAMTFERAVDFCDEDDLIKVQKRVKLLKMGIDELGEVNLASIPEYERVNERYQFLTKQKDDLLQAIHELKSSMSEIDTEVATRFKTTFDKVASQFEKLFPQMFEGGNAHLSLTDPSNLLETGIEIFAQPPGKKTQKLQLLSGGERSLTAITLLFSLVNVKPVPFIILDEAEAALDDANVNRYSQYLRKIDTKTQFIVVTHRQGTMVQADVLYGVTMQESGVSKIVSVSLEEVQ